MRYHLALDDARTDLENSGCDGWIENDEDRATITDLMFHRDMSAPEAIAEHYGDALDEADRRTLLAENPADITA